jgi:hypothetical protein
MLNECTGNRVSVRERKREASNVNDEVQADWNRKLRRNIFSALVLLFRSPVKTGI